MQRRPAPESAIAPPTAAGKDKVEPNSLLPEDRMLILLRDELYEGRWDLLQQDLQDRLAGRPFVFKLVNRIQDDLRRIDRLERLCL